MIAYTNENKYIPLAIIVAGALIALSVYITNTVPADAVTSGTVLDVPTREASLAHRIGSKDAPITIIEFSDFECPYCARLHPVLKSIIEESKGDIAWEFRHLPLPSHKGAERAAYASECVAKTAGNDAFWEYTDRLFTEQRTLSREKLESIASEFGVDSETLTSCMDDPAIHKLVAGDRDTAISFGGSGTPFSVVLFPDNTVRPVSGALPKEQWLALIDGWDN